MYIYIVVVPIQMPGRGQGLRRVQKEPITVVRMGAVGSSLCTEAPETVGMYFMNDTFV